MSRSTPSDGWYDHSLTLFLTLTSSLAVARKATLTASYALKLADHLIFMHASSTLMAHILFGETKVTSIEFAPTDESGPGGLPSLGFSGIGNLITQRWQYRFH